MKKLSVIIPFLNEGYEVLSTLDSLFSTTNKDFVEVIIINDGSKDKYEEEIKSRGAIYLENPIRKGVAFSRDLGVKSCSCKAACFFDAHMRFRNDNWAERMVSEVEKSPDSLFCTICVRLDPEYTEMTENKPKGYGAGIQLVTGSKKEAEEILELKWILLKKRESVYDVPAVLGANYFFNVNQYKKLLGLSGLECWGSDEIYLSLKYWLSGGACKVCTDIEIGHIFRKGCHPYSTSTEYLYFNKLLVSFTLFPDNVSQKLLGKLRDNESLREGLCLFRRNLTQIIEYKRYYDSVFTRTFSQVSELLGLKTI